MTDSGSPRTTEVRVLAALERFADREREADRSIVVAFSGGIDSTVLLAGLARTFDPDRLTAVHVDHGLHPDSARWARDAVAAATDIGVECTVVTVDARPAAGQSAEAAAREARYAALARLHPIGSTLVTAHHADDQLETVLLRLFRGSGVRGLQAIHAEAPFAAGRLVRPLLDFTRAEIAATAAAWGLGGLSDPSNADLRFDRNFVRGAVAPSIRERWPAAGRVAVRAARHMRSAQHLLDALAGIDAGPDFVPDRFPVARLAGLDAERKANLLRFLIERAQLPLPDESRLRELVRQLEVAPGGALHVAWPGAEARLYRGQLYLQEPPAPRPQPGPAGRIDPVSGWRGPEGSLTLVPASGRGIPGTIVDAGLVVAFRQGGERFSPAGRAGERSLKRWFNENGVVPWMRARVPLVFSGERLVAVADLAVADLPRADRDPEWRLEWTPPRRIG